MELRALEGLRRTLRLRGSARLKRVIILPFFVIMLAGFTVSWFVYLSASRSALSEAMTALITEVADRAVGDTLMAVSRAMATAKANAALLSRAGDAERDLPFLRAYYLDELMLQPQLAILAAGFADGEYREAQRLADGSFRVAEAGAATDGALVFRPVGSDGRPGPVSLSRPGYDPRQRPWYRNAAVAGGPQWSEPYPLYSNEEQAMAAAVPFYDSRGELRGVVTATLSLSDLSALLASYRDAGEGYFFIVDRYGKLIASSLGVESILDDEGQRARAVQHGDPRVAAIAAAAGLPRPGELEAPPAGPAYFSVSLDGEPYRGLRVRHTNDEGLDWVIACALLESAYASPLAKADRLVMAVLVSFILAAFAVGWWVVSYVTRPLRQLTAAAASLELGAGPAVELEGLAARKDELGRLARAFVSMKLRLGQSYGAVERSLVEKEILLKEVHHRVKNNLQIVSSILSLQADSLDECGPGTRQAFEECQDRIQAMALVHEEVYQGNSFERLDMGSYLGKICEALAAGKRGYAQIDVTVEAAPEAQLAMESAIPLGLIVNELVTNSLKYAFEGRQEGSVSVRFVRDGDDWALTVTDDGVGLPPPAERREGVGSQLVRGLAAQLKARLEYGDGPEGRGLAVALAMDARGVR